MLFTFPFLYDNLTALRCSTQVFHSNPRHFIELGDWRPPLSYQASSFLLTSGRATLVSSSPCSKERRLEIRECGAAQSSRLLFTFCRSEMETWPAHNCLYSIRSQTIRLNTVFSDRWRLETGAGPLCPCSKIRTAQVTSQNASFHREPALRPGSRLSYQGN